LSTAPHPSVVAIRQPIVMAAARAVMLSRTVAAPRVGGLARRAIPACTVPPRTAIGFTWGALASPRHLAERDQRRQRSGIATAAAGGGDGDGGSPARQDQLLRSISDLGELVVLVVDGTDVVNEAMRRHRCSPTAAVALGRSLIGALLMGSFKKDGEVTQISITGNGDLGRILCIATTDGMVKGMVTNPNVNMTRPDGVVDVAGAVGPGTVSVVRSHPTWREPYSGTVPIVSGEIAEDLAQYLSDSEQQRCALAAAVTLNGDGSVAAAGGYLIQALPLISDESLDFLERNIKTLMPITDLLGQGFSCADITAMLLRDLGVSPGADSKVPNYGPCDPEDLKLRMRRAIATLGEEEARDLIAEKGVIEITCDFCKISAQFDEASVEETLAAAKGDS